MGWLFLLHPRIGLVNAWLRLSFGAAATRRSTSLSIAGMGWVQGLNLAPLAFIMTAAVFRAMDPTLEESARRCRARASPRTLRRITLPLAWPGVLAAGIYIFMIGFAAFDVPAIIGWASRLFTFSTYLLLQLNPDRTGCRVTARRRRCRSTLIALAGLISWWYGPMQRRAHRYRVVTGKAYRPMIVRARPRRNAAAWVFLGALFRLQHLLPVLVLLWASVLPYLPAAVGGGVRVGLAACASANLPWDLIGKGLVNTALLMVLTPTVTLA